MKREGYLIEKIADMDNLRLAFHKAQQGKRTRKDVILFYKELEKNLLQLRNELLSGNVKVGDYHLFKIYDPKERVVCAAAFRERVMHHAIMNICAPIFERHFIATTYANRLGKGVYKALETAFLAVNTYDYVAKLDVRKYFDNIDHVVLMDLLRRLFKDKQLLDVFRQIIQSYSVASGKGVPIGNLTSQYFANYYLSSIDHYAKEQLCIPVYVRYMDDMLIFGTNRDHLKAQICSLVKEIANRLSLTMKPPIIQYTERPIAFLGYSLSKHKVVLSQRSKRRFIHKYNNIEKALEIGKYTEIEAQERMLPLLAFVQHAYTKQYRARIYKKVTSRRGLTA